ncbi:MAG: cytochrome c peroxidase [Planctomycetaceae bacterium]
MMKLSQSCGLFAAVLCGCFVLVAGEREAMAGDDAALRSIAPGPLSSVRIPLPPDLDDYIRDREAAIALGKMFFWDIQTGSDGLTSCGTCHFHAGVDVRTANTLAPRLGTEFLGANYSLTLRDFPFHKKKDPAASGYGPDNVARDSSQVTGSQGVIRTEFLGLHSPPRRVDIGRPIPDPTFHVGGINTRQVTGRNTPTIFNAVYQDRLLWDGRASHFFNGVSNFGETDSTARVWRADGGRLSPVSILLKDAPLASVAVGPPLNDVELTFVGRTFPEIGRKLLSMRPLAHQHVDPTDGTLGKYVSRRRYYGLALEHTYENMIQRAFQPQWWSGTGVVDGGWTQMEANFSLYWGLAVMIYEAELVSGDSPYDRWAAGDDNALTPLQKEGLDLFLNEGKCVKCHGGPEFTHASLSYIRETDHFPVEKMVMADGRTAWYDTGFYNIGVRPSADDLGVGDGRVDETGRFLPFSLTARSQTNTMRQDGSAVVPGGAKIAVNGAFKTPSLRNVELTGPFMHNGGMATLRQVVEFYARGGDFANHPDRDFDIQPIPEIQGDDHKIDALVAFLTSLTDDRVRHQRAPFDHPELWVPNGHGAFSHNRAFDELVQIPAVGKAGGPALRSFEEILRRGGLSVRR